MCAVFWRISVCTAIIEEYIIAKSMIAFDLVNWKRAIIHSLKPRIRHSKDRYRNLKEGKEKNITAPKQQYLTSCLLDNILKSPRHQFFKCQSQLAKYEWLLMGCPFVQKSARRMGIFMYGCYVFSSMRIQVQQCSISKIQLNWFFKAFNLYQKRWLY